MNWFLIIVAIVVVIVTILINIRLLSVYLDPEEKHQGGGYFPKFCLVLGLSLAAFASLLLPFDVANRKDPTIREDTGGEIDVALMWQITLWGIAGMSIVVLPFALFYYEAWDPNGSGDGEQEGNAVCVAGHQFASAICYTTIYIIAFAAILCLVYFGAGIDTALLDYQGYNCTAETVQLQPCYRFMNDSATDANPACTDVDTRGFAEKCSEYSGEMKIPISMFVATIAVLTCIGWVLFVVFGGVGLASLPIEMCHAFYENKLVAMDKTKFIQIREEVKVESRDLLAMADRIQERLDRNKQQVKKVNALQLACDNVEKKHRRIQRYNQKSEFSKLASPFIIWGRLLLAIICVAWSVMWIVHILVHNTFDFHPVLNNMFLGLDDAFGLLGTVAYASFSFYLLWATVNGCFKVGANFLIFTIHPMKPHGTLMSSFLFNAILVLLATTASVSFCAQSFRLYVANTVVDTLYASYINNVQYLMYIMEYLQYGLLAFCLIGLCWYTCKGARTTEQLLKENED
eukprot:TRINITY_DN31050_c0_g1_i1.p1 TRINITY_DN31050_c0_g1~~TRINITY_DN31050_c0_g1_i1.p1  ORF type:complete len:516 (+),score=179.03 TRINITY_DN31050_c0_g1_i1:309-1856(+)